MEIEHLWATCSTAGPLPGGMCCFVLSSPSLHPFLLILLPCPAKEPGSVISLQALGAAFRSQGSCSCSRLLESNSIASPHRVFHLLQHCEVKKAVATKSKCLFMKQHFKIKSSYKKCLKKKKKSPLIKTKPPNPSSLQVLRMQLKLKLLLSATICHVHQSDIIAKNPVKTTLSSFLNGKFDRLF